MVWGRMGQRRLATDRMRSDFHQPLLSSCYEKQDVYANPATNVTANNATLSGYYENLTPPVRARGRC